MRDPSLGTNGGYADAWYQVLDTEPIHDLPASCTLSFYQRYSVESCGSWDIYEGCDGMNIRVSTDNGTTWEILTSVSPAYNYSNLYSFSFLHSEGPVSIPGWGGELTDWTQVTADLSAYSGQTIVIRFAFASDPGTSTISGGNFAAMFGWQVDDIVVSNSTTTLFSNNGTEGNLFPHNRYGGDLWNITTEEGGNHFANCNNEANTYQKWMENPIVSNSIQLPDVDNIKMDFKLRGTFEDHDPGPPPGPPQYDYFSAYVHVFDEQINITNITMDGQDEVFYNAPDTWTLYSQAYDENFDRQPVDLSTLRGQTIQLIFDFTSDSDEPIGKAIQIDDIIIYTPGVVAVEPGYDIPYRFALEQNYPNPFNPVTNIRYQVAESGFVSVKIYDLLGNELKTLVNEEKPAGNYTIQFDGNSFASGVYLCVYKVSSMINNREFSKAIKISLIK